MQVSDPVLASTIGALGALSGASLTATATFLTNRTKEDRRFSKSSRESAIKGTWVGEGHDFFTEETKEKFGFSLRLELDLKGRRVVGEGRLEIIEGSQSVLAPRSNDRRPPVLVLNGGFFDDNYIQLTYQSNDPTRQQMGVIMFRLSGGGQTVKGHYAGYSPMRETFVVGSVELNKL
jgi:hypothetical protein